MAAAHEDGTRWQRSGVNAGSTCESTRHTWSITPDACIAPVTDENRREMVRIRMASKITGLAGKLDFYAMDYEDLKVLLPILKKYEAG